MSRLVSSSGWYRLAPLVLLPGCLVSFNDYPLGATGSAGDTSSSGSPSSGGVAAQSGGTTTGGTTTGGADSQRLIDDFEDADSAIPEHEGRSGDWYAANDGDGLQTPANNMAVVPVLLDQPRGASQRAVHTFGGPFDVWGALIGTSLASEDGVGAPYDVSNYQGIRFWVRYQSFSPAVARSVRFSLPTTVTNDGGACTTCDDHFGAEIPLTAQWVRHEVRFSQLAQAGFGVPQLGTPELERATSIQFFFPRGVSFDLWLDDVELF